MLAVLGEVDVATAPRLREELFARLRTGPVVLDLSALAFLDSSGVRVLSHALRACATEGLTLRVRPRLTDAVRQILEMTGMLAVLPLEREEDLR